MKRRDKLKRRFTDEVDSPFERKSVDIVDGLTTLSGACELYIHDEGFMMSLPNGSQE